MILRILSQLTLLVIIGSWSLADSSYYSGDKMHHMSPADSSYYSHDHMTSGKSRCEEITIPMCRGIGYNMTSYPNEFYHESQDEAGMEVSLIELTIEYL